MNKNIANILTASRILLAIVFCSLVSVDAYHVAFFVFLVASLTDFLDGFLARRRGITSVFGRMADPFADKLLIILGFLFLVEKQVGVSAWVVAVIIGREMLVTSLRGYVEGKSADFSANVLGKCKMFIQSTSLAVIVLFQAFFQSSPYKQWLFAVAIWMTILITTLSGAVYVVQALRITRPKPNA